MKFTPTQCAFLCATAFAFNAYSQPSSPASSVVSKSTTAIGYQVGGGATKIGMNGTALLPQAAGEAKVQARSGVTSVEVKIAGLSAPSKLGTEFLTYVLWAVSTEGRTINIGEVVVDKNGAGKLATSVQLQTFSLIVTAEPYFSVRQPSELVVVENALLKGTKGKIFPITEYKLMHRAQYAKMDNPMALTLDLKNVPLEMYQARNAVDIAKSRQAAKYAPEILTKAEASLKMAENSLTAKANKKETISTARQAIQFSEDARALSTQRQDDERIAAEKAAAAAKAKAEAEAKAAAEAAEAKRVADAAAASARASAQAEARRQAELTAAREAQMKAESEAAAAKAKAEADILAARGQAARAEAERAKAEAERASKAAEALRAQLLDQFSRILETRDTPRGLVVNMADVLFDTGKFNLRPPTREKLARLAGIVLAHPGLNLEVEGHTDSTGSDELNQKLSEQRAETTRAFLIEQGLQAAQITSKGFGKTMPVADNATAAGRQQNRRVEIIVSGEVIGSKIGAR